MKQYKNISLFNLSAIINKLFFINEHKSAIPVALKVINLDHKLEYIK